MIEIKNIFYEVNFVNAIQNMNYIENIHSNDNEKFYLLEDFQLILIDGKGNFYNPLQEIKEEFFS